ncbi:chloride channel [Aureococcus anophagefferens]|nr:chloride channel [Aureococcus anophagefferens]
MMLEEKEINYAVELINMRSYGDKPASFTAKVRGGILPALELDGTMYTESLDIMAMLDDAFADGRRALLPDRESPEWERTRALLRLERSLFSAWCAYVFGGGFGSKRNFEAAMRKVDAALGDQPGPWFSDFSDGPSLVDLQYVSHVERIAASVPYWRGDVPGWEAFEADAATEAAYHVIDNLDAVAAFAARQRRGGWARGARRARLADRATPAEGAVRDAVQDALSSSPRCSSRTATWPPRTSLTSRRGGDSAAVRSARLPARARRRARDVRPAAAAPRDPQLVPTPQ